MCNPYFVQYIVKLEFCIIDGIIEPEVSLHIGMDLNLFYLLT